MPQLIGGLGKRSLRANHRRAGRWRVERTDTRSYVAKVWRHMRSAFLPFVRGIVERLRSPTPVMPQSEIHSRVRVKTMRSIEAS
jgi:hypothetical protein